MANFQFPISNGGCQVRQALPWTLTIGNWKFMPGAQR